MEGQKASDTSTLLTAPVAATGRSHWCLRTPMRLIS